MSEMTNKLNTIKFVNVECCRDWSFATKIS